MRASETRPGQWPRWCWPTSPCGAPRAGAAPSKCAKGASPRGAAGRLARESSGPTLLDEILQRLERRRAHLLLRRLALDDDGLLGERVDAGTILRRRLLDGAQLEQAGDHELTVRLPKLLLDELRQTVKHATDALLIELGVLRDLGYDLRLRQTLGRHFGFLLSTRIDENLLASSTADWLQWATSAVRRNAAGGTSMPPVAASTRKRLASRFRVPPGKNSGFRDFVSWTIEARRVTHPA